MNIIISISELEVEKKIGKYYNYFNKYVRVLLQTVSPGKF